MSASKSWLISGTNCTPRTFALCDEGPIIGAGFEVVVFFGDFASKAVPLQ